MLSEIINESLHEPSLRLCSLSALAGILSHIGFFAHGELDLLTWQILLGHIVLPTGFVTFLALAPDYNFTWATATKITSFISIIYLLGIFSSLLTYRLFFHPLRRIPGPLGCKISNWYNVYLCAKTGNQYHYLTREWHKKYGTIVRVGPNAVTVNHQDIIPIMSKAEKGPWYNVGWPDYSLQTTRNIETHRIRRKVWDKAFTADALERYTPKVAHHCGVLIEELSKVAKQEEPVLDVSKILNAYTFEMMGDITFTKEYHQLRPKNRATAELEKLSSSPDKNKIELTRGGMESVGMFGHVPYMFLIFLSIPQTVYTKFVLWCLQEVEERQGRQELLKDKPKDIFAWLLEAEPQNVYPHYVTPREDARLAIVAGSDTTAAAITNVLFHLANNDQMRKKLQSQIDSFYPGAPGKDTTTAVPKEILSGKCTYLQAIINEALRLNPPVPNGGQRVIPKGGCTIDGKFLPEGTSFQWPMYTAMRNETAFPSPDEFLPERWLSSSATNTLHTADEGLSDSPTPNITPLPSFYPFWLGPYSCVGRGLAQIQMRMTIARIIRQFDFSLPTIKEKGSGKIRRVDEDWLRERAKDNFTLEMGEVPVAFRER